MNFLVTGDTHGRNMSRISNIPKSYEPKDTALIILGDSGINFYLNKIDKKNKRAINSTGFHIYCVRGNHEERPENISSMIKIYDPHVRGIVWVENEFSNIRYFVDGEQYLINGHKVLVIGGAYSVDKDYRLAKFHKDAKWTGWFKDEQLTHEEMEAISNKYKGENFDFVFSHTCPYSWRPTHLFLSSINQDTVDNSMELWLDKLKDEIHFDFWLFGHFHATEQVNSKAGMIYTEIFNLEDFI